MTVYALDKSPTGPRLRFRGVIALVGGVFAMIPVGTAYTLGNFSPYIISYLRNRTDDTDLRNVDSLWIGMVATVSQVFGSTLGGILDRHFGTRPTIALGGLIFSGAVVVCYFFVKMSFIALIIVFGFVHNTGAKVIYGISVQMAILWLPGRSSLAAGLVLGGYGAGALVFNQVITAYINPDNLSPDLVTDDGERYFTDPDLLDRVPYCFLLLGFTYLVMQIIGAMVISSPEQQRESVTTVGLDQNGVSMPPEKPIFVVTGTLKGATDSSIEVPSSEVTRIDKQSSGTNDITNKTPAAKTSVKEVIISTLRTRNFYVVWTTVISFSWSLRFIASLYKSYGQMFIHDDAFLALSGTLSSIFNCVGRPCWGMVMDKFGYRTTIRCISVIYTLVCATFVLTEHLHKAAFMVWICAVFAMYSGVWSVVPSTFAKLFGAENTAINYGFVFIATALASVGTLVVGTTMKDTLGYHGIFYIAAALGALPFFLTFLFNGVEHDGRRI